MWDKLQRVYILLLMVVLAVVLSACGSKVAKSSRVNTLSISEVSPPDIIQRLSRTLDRYMPQVTIVSPRSDEVLSDTTVKVAVEVKDLPIFQSAMGLGPHLDVVLDEREARQIYDPTTPAVFENVTPGTHTIRVFASRPWDESFKNEGAYAQTTFHVLTRTGEHVLRPDTPVLTYHSPIGTVGSDTVLLDFYLHNAPVPASLLDSKEPPSWQVRATVNGDSFTIEDWHPLYLKGLKPGRNWIKLEFLDPVGNPLPNLSNSIAQIVTYDPQQRDPLSLILQGQVPANVEQIVDPNYSPTPITPSPEVTTPPLESVSPTPAAPVSPTSEVTTPPQESAPPTPAAPVPPPPEVTTPPLEAPPPVKQPRFQLFRKKAKVEQPPAPTEEMMEVQPQEKATPIPTEEAIKAQEIPAAPSNSEKAEEQPQGVSMEEVTPSPAPQPQSPAQEPQAEPKVGRFQSLKARYQKLEESTPPAIPEQLGE
ncbi:MAG: hypothetical protein RMK91_04315 [Pseudanabaenaceae cyanobacterium SKYGB_i_bin29]|nr:hypothetical protein [Pseudanabaenaceae cyanobacterium SKYG29]MDW8421069.1 hypothetical protein [Pseudanabaenaceae cyanobacterium SKYGB_i_bin29]